MGGEITRGLDATSLHNRLMDALDIKRPTAKKPGLVNRLIRKEEDEDKNL